MPTARFTDEEIKYVKYFSEKYEQGWSEISWEKIAQDFGIDDPWSVGNRVRKLLEYGLISCEATGSYDVHVGALEAWQQISHVPTPDYWQELKVWMFRSKWRVGVIAIGVVLPLLWSWLEMISGLTRWVLSAFN